MSTEKMTQRAKFEAAFGTIRGELLAGCKRRGIPAEAMEWYRQSLEYNVLGGKLNRGLSVVDSAEIFKGRVLMEEEYQKAAVLGWCIELVSHIFYEDVTVRNLLTSRSFTRVRLCRMTSYGRIHHPSRAAVLVPRPAAPAPVVTTNTSSKSPKRRLVSHIAINDALIIPGGIFELLKKHFRSDAYYIHLLELFRECIYNTQLGQMTDLITAPEGDTNLSCFSVERHRLIVAYKTAYYSFHLPIAAAMYMCNIPESYTVNLGQESKTIHPHDIALSILIPIGEYFQIQDDFLDFAAPPEVLGKIGTDIVDNKCSWCINMALELCNPEQRRILERNYGRKGDIEAGAEGADDDKKAESEEVGGLCEKRVKEVYEAVGLRKVYADYEERVFKQLNELIDTIPDGVILDDSGQRVEVHNGLKKQVFRTFLDKIYGRGK